MIGSANIATNCLRSIKRSNLIFSQLNKGWAGSSRLYASDSRRRGAPGNGGPLKRNGNNANATEKQSNILPSACNVKTVQVRTQATGPSAPLAPPPPPQGRRLPVPPPYAPPTPSQTPSRPVQPSSRSPYSSAPPPPPPGAEKQSNLLRNLLVGFLIAAASAGGLYYSGLLDGDETAKKDDLAADRNKKKKSTRPVLRNPPNKEDFPAKVPYVLIGGGTASFAAFRAIKSKDPLAKVLVISAEDSLPYMRPPLSKEIWKNSDLPDMDKLTFKQWNGQERNLYYEPKDFYTNIKDLESSANGGVSVATGWVVSSVDTANNCVQIEDPAHQAHFTVQYDKCLIATGSTPKNLAVFERAAAGVQERTVLYRNVRDLEALWGRLQGARSVAIVGGGFLGSELACSLARKYKDSPAGPEVYQIFKETGNMGRVLPEYLSQWTTDRVKEEGVEVLPSVEVLQADLLRNQVLLTLSNGKPVKADVVIVAVGSEPCTQLAETSSLEVDPTIGGFLVNAELEARTNLYVAGDSCCFYDPLLGRRRVEHHDHAVISGRLAGENMAGGAAPYKHQSMFWSDLGPDVGYEAIGIIDSCLPTVAVFAKGDESKPEESKSTAESKQDKTNEGRLTVTNPESKTVPKSNKEEVKDGRLTINNPDSKLEDKEKAGEVTAEKKANGEYSKGVVFYLRNDMVVGIVLWNIFNRMHVARQVIADRRKYEDLNEVAKLFKLHED